MSEQQTKVLMIDPGAVQPNPYQMRTKINPKQFAELKSIVEKNNHIDAITVTELGDGTYQLVDGQQRLKVALELRWEKIPATITDNENLISKTFAANFFRYKLNAVQGYDGLKKVMQEHNLKTQQELAEYLNVSEPTVSQMLSVEHLPSKIKNAIRESDLIYPLRKIYRISAMKNKDEMQPAFAKLTQQIKDREKDKKEGKSPKAKVATTAGESHSSKIVRGVTRIIEKTFIPKMDKIQETINSEETSEQDKQDVRAELTKLRDRINELINS